MSREPCAWSGKLFLTNQRNNCGLEQRRLTSTRRSPTRRANVASETGFLRFKKTRRSQKSRTYPAAAGLDVRVHGERDGRDAEAVQHGFQVGLNRQDPQAVRVLLIGHALPGERAQSAVLHVPQDSASLTLEITDVAIPAEDRQVPVTERSKERLRRNLFEATGPFRLIRISII